MEKEIFELLKKKIGLSKEVKIYRGVNEVTKAVEKKLVELVVLAKDVAPKEVIYHLPFLCKEKKVLCVENIFSLKELGESSGLKVKTSALGLPKVEFSKEESALLEKYTKELTL